MARRGVINLLALMCVLLALFLGNVRGADMSGGSDPRSCETETFLMAIKRQSKDPKYKRGDNPCSKSCGGAGSYCQCRWSMSSCQGTRPDCPVEKTCKPCPRGYTCTGDGKARPPMGSVVDFFAARANDFMASLRGAAPPS